MEPTSTLSYSLDEGLSWTDVTFTSNGPMDVRNVIIEPSANSSMFIVYGVRRSEASVTGVLVSLDFTATWPKECTGENAPDAKGSDYELWAPYDAAEGSSSCVLGRKITYVRRKRDASCYNGKDHESLKTVETCACEADDWECDFGWEPVDPYGRGISHECVPAGPLPAAAPPTVCPPNTQYAVSQGYRKVAADLCDEAKGGFNKGPITKDCPGGAAGPSPPILSSGSSKAIILVLLLLAAVASVVACYVNRRTLARLYTSAALPMPAMRSSAGPYAGLGNSGPETVGLEDDDHDLMSSPQLLGEDDIRAGGGVPAALPVASGNSGGLVRDAGAALFGTAKMTSFDATLPGAGKQAARPASPAVPTLQPPRKGGTAAGTPSAPTLDQVPVREP